MLIQSKTPYLPIGGQIKMGRHLSLVILLCGSIAHQIQGQIKSFTVFPLCTSSAGTQSEKLNLFHQRFAEFSQVASISNFKKFEIDIGASGCSTGKWRGLAAAHSIEGYFQGDYLIENDSVWVNLSYVNTLFIDKAHKFSSVSGRVDSLPEILEKAYYQIFNWIEFVPDSSSLSHLNKVTGLQKNSIVLETIAPSMSGDDVILQNAKSAYFLGNYSLAVEISLTIEPTSPRFGESQFLVGKCVLIQNEYSKALVYFKRAEAAGMNNDELKEYIYQAQHSNKPAMWYDSEIKRRQWYQELSKDDLLVVLQLMNDLHISDHQVGAAYEFRDNDIQKLLSTTVLTVSDSKIKDFSVYKTFTNADILLVANCKFDSANGLSSFSRLRVLSIRKSNLLDFPEAGQFLGKNKVLIVGN